MDEKEAIEKIEEGLKVIKRDSSQLYKFVGLLFNLASHISNEHVKKEIESELVVLQSLTGERSIVAKTDEIINYLEEAKERTGNPLENTFVGKQHGVRRVTHSDKYLEDLKKYSNMEGHIRDVEARILYDTEYVKNHHELIREHRKYAGYLHARLRGNIRIMDYIMDGELVFDEIITKNEFDSTR